MCWLWEKVCWWLVGIPSCMVERYHCVLTKSYWGERVRTQIHFLHMYSCLSILRHGQYIYHRFCNSCLCSLCPPLAFSPLSICLSHSHFLPSLPSSNHPLIHPPIHTSLGFPPSLPASIHPCVPRSVHPSISLIKIPCSSCSLTTTYATTGQPTGI